MSTPYRTAAAGPPRRPYKAPKLKPKRMTNLARFIWSGQGRIIMARISGRFAFWVPLDWVPICEQRWRVMGIDSFTSSEAAAQTIFPIMPFYTGLK